MWRRLAIYVAIGGALAVLMALFGPAARQRRGMEGAKQLEASIAPRLAADPRFAAVHTAVATVPALRIFGEVPDERALADLHALIRLPEGAQFRLSWQVKVTSPPASQPGT